MNIQTAVKNDFILNNLASFFDEDIYLVGGAVRDILLDKEIVDRDLIVINKDIREFSIKAADFLGAKFVSLDEENKIYRLIMPDKVNYLDITCPVGGTLEKDIERRDLTINAVCINIKTGEIIDPAGGIKDFKEKILRGIKEENFADDPLRLLRIFRFHAVLGFEISPELMQIAKKYSNLINKPARERVEYELMKLFGGQFAHSALLKMDEAGILERIFLFTKELKQVPPNAHHHLDLFHHSIETVRQIGILYQSESDEVKQHFDRVDFGGFSRLAHLRLAAFMHDIGKFSTWTTDEDTGRHRFIKHEEVGTQMCQTILRQLAFSNKQINYIKTIIKNHMYPSMVVSAPELTDKVMMRYVRKSGDDALDMILIAKADRLSALGVEITKETVEENITLLNKLRDFYIKSLEVIKPLPKLLDGNEVMEILKITPSRRLGEIMKALHEAQISGEVITREDAIDFVRQF